MPFETALEINKFSFSYGKKKILNDLSIGVASGSIHGLVGPNGTGKTTLFDAIFQHHLYPEIIIASGLEKEIAFLPTDPYFYPYMTGMEYLRIVSGKKEKQEIERWKDVFDLPLQEYVHHYSTGMKKKIALLGVVLLNKKILLLDEPTNGLDMDSCEAVYLILEKLKLSGHTIFITSHIYETLTKSCDRITLLQSGLPCRTFERKEFDQLADQIKGDFQEKFQLLLNELLAH